MTINYTTLLGLTEPVTGTQSGTWGSDINTGLTDYVEAAIAGAQVISGSQTAVTLSVTTGSSSAPTTLSQAGSGATGSSQYQIIRCTGNPAGLLTITAPASDKTYVILNATSTSQAVKIVGAGPTTGVTIVSGERAFVAWNGSDFVKVGGAAGGINTQVQYNNNGVFGGITNATTDGTTLSMTSPKVITSINDTNGAELLKVTATASAVNELTLANAATGNAPTLSATGDDLNIGITLTPKGTGAVTVSTLLNVDNLRLDGNTLSSTDSGGNIVLAPNGTGDVQLDADTVRIGDSNANATLTTNGTGDLILSTNSGTNSGTITIQDGVNGNIILAPNGTGAVQETVSSTNYNIVSQSDIGTAPNEIPLNQYLGSMAYQDGDTSDITVYGVRVGRGAGGVSTNTAVGASALNANTTASNNTAVGYQAGYSNTASTGNTFIGAQAGQNYNNTSGAGNNVIVGYFAGNALTTGIFNTLVGTGQNGAGAAITTGSKNTVIGAYSGNQGGLDIRTASNYIVLSDGDGNPRIITDNNGLVLINRTTGAGSSVPGLHISGGSDTTSTNYTFYTVYSNGTAVFGLKNDKSIRADGVYNTTSASAANVYVDSGGILYRSTSALKYKQDVRDLEEIDINKFRSVRYKSKCVNDDQTKDHFGVIADEAADAGFEELVTRGADGEVEGFQYERLTVVLLKAIQTMKSELDSVKAELAALKGA